MSLVAADSDCWVSLAASEIGRHELDIVVRTAKWVQACRNMPAGRRPPVVVGRVGGRYLLLEGWETYEASAAGGRIDCRVVDCATEEDFLIEHVRRNRPNTTINPLMLARIAERLSRTAKYGGGGAGMTDEWARVLQLDGTIHAKFMSLRLAPEAFSTMTDLCTELGRRLTHFILPYYIPLFISRYPPAVQAGLARAVSSLVMNGTTTDARFSWPSPEEVEIMFAAEAEPPEESGAVVVVPDGDRPTDESVGRAEQIVRRARDVVAIPATESHPTYVVDLKTRRVSAVEETDSVIRLHDTGHGDSSFLFPPKVGRWLVHGVDEGVCTDGVTEGGGPADDSMAEDIRMYTFADAAKLAEFARRTRDKKLRGVIFYRPK